MTEIASQLQPSLGPATVTRRALFVSRVGYLGGVERVILTLADGLQLFGWQPIIASPAGGALEREAIAQESPTVVCNFDRMRITANPWVLAGYPSAWYRGAGMIERRCRELEINIIHVHHPVTALYAMVAARKLDIPLILTVHETLPSTLLYSLAMRTALKRVTMTFCVSEAARTLAIAMGVDRAKAVVVHNGVDARFFDYVPNGCLPTEMEGAGPGPHIGLFGVLEPRKAQHVLLEAAFLILKRVPTARFWLIGPAALKDKQGYVERLRILTEAKPLRGRVALVGYQANVQSWIAAMDIVVQTSVRLESFGMSLAEALVLGRPVVASRVGGMPEVVRDGKTGLIVPPGDIPALAAALISLIESPATRADMGVRGAADARARFSPKVFQTKIVAAYDLLTR